MYEPQASPATAGDKRRGFSAWHLAFLITILALWLTPLAYGQDTTTISFEQLYGDSSSSGAESIEQTADGGSIAIGNLAGSSGEATTPFYVLKLAADGTVLWSELVTVANEVLSAHSVRQTSDGGYVIAGTTHRDGVGSIFLVKLAVDGSVSWTILYASTKAAGPPIVRETDGGGFVVAAAVQTSSGSAGFLLRTDAQGTRNWASSYAGPGAFTGFSDIRQNPDGGFVLAGWTGATLSHRSLLAVRMDPPPNRTTPPTIRWASAFGGPQDDLADAALEGLPAGNDETFVLAAFDGRNTLLLATDDSNVGRTVRWQHFIQGFHEHSIRQTFSQTFSPGLVLGGSLSVGAALIQIDTDGAFQHGMSYGASYAPAVSAAVPTTDGGYLLAGRSLFSYQRFYVVKTDPSLQTACSAKVTAPQTLPPSFFGQPIVLIATADFFSSAAAAQRDLQSESGFSACSSPSNGCVKPPPDLTLWLPFDEDSGRTALNAEGGNAGTYHGNPSPSVRSSFVGLPLSTAAPAAKTSISPRLTSADAILENALCFSDDQSWVEVPSYDGIEIGTKDFSIDAWVKRSSTDRGLLSTIVDKRFVGSLDDPVVGYAFFMIDGVLWMQLADGQPAGRSYDNYPSDGGLVPLDGLYHHVAVTVHRRATPAAPALGQFYLDGMPVGTFNPGNHPSSVTTNVALRVGHSTESFQGGRTSLRGCVDEVEIFDRALSGDEIAGVSNAGVNGKCKWFCSLPAASPFCTFDNSIIVNGQICNSNAADVDFQYSFQSLPVSAACPFAGPESFTPAAGPIIVEAGSCAQFPVTISRPPNLPAGSFISRLGCYQMFVQSAARSTACKGSVQTIDDLCIVGNQTVNLRSLLPSPVPIAIQSTSPAQQTFPYELIALSSDLTPTQAVSLNGLPAGTPLHGTASLPPGGSLALGVSAAFAQFQPNRAYTLLLQGDLHGDGTMEPLASVALQNVLPATCPQPSIVSAPKDQTVEAGQPLTLSAAAASTGTPSFRWRRNGVALADGGPISGATSNVLKIAPASGADAGLFDVQVTDSCGAVISPAAHVSVAGATCTPGADTLCLNGGRFKVEVGWRTQAGVNGTGHAVQITGQAGFFWFFDPANLELGVKIFDACSLDQRFWFFATALTDLDVTLDVTDTQTGALRRYLHAGGTAFAPIQDTSAFACSPSPAAGRAGSEPAAARPQLPAPRSQSTPAAIAASSALFLGGRFRVEAQWEILPGLMGTAQAVSVTGDSGYFWFFDDSNLELFVKVLDGCTVNRHYWAFAGGLTDVMVELKITDSLTGAVKSYANSRGTAFSPILDTSAFATCP